MKSSTIDRVKHKITPTLFGLFETQFNSMLNNVYNYIYDKDVYSGPAITGCRGPVSGGYKKVTLTDVTGEFNAYAYNQELQKAILVRVNKYVEDFESATINIPTKDQYKRLLEVRESFQANIKNEAKDTNHQDYSITMKL